MKATFETITKLISKTLDVIRIIFFISLIASKNMSYIYIFYNI